MPNAYKPGLIQVRVQYTSALTDEPDVPENILWLITGYTGSYTTATLTTIAAEWDAQWALVWKTVGSGNYHYVGAVYTDWSSSTGASYSSVGVFSPVAGSLTSFVGGNVAALISWTGQSLPRYKGGHFRTYLPYVAQGALTSPYQILSSVVTTCNTAIATMLTNMEGFTVSIGGVNYQVSPTLFRFRDNPVKAQTYITLSGQLSAMPATQRRRVRKVTHK